MDSRGMRQYNFYLKKFRVYFFDFTYFLAGLLHHGKVIFHFGVIATSDFLTLFAPPYRCLPEVEGCDTCPNGNASQ